MEQEFAGDEMFEEAEDDFEVAAEPADEELGLEGDDLGELEALDEELEDLDASDDSGFEEI